MTEDEKLKMWIRTYFRDDRDNPFEVTDGQLEIFKSIFYKEFPRFQIIAPTQYGKSNIVSMAVILRSQMFAEDWKIVTGQQTKSEVIMGKVIQHLFDSPDLLAQLDIDPNEPLDRIRRERTKKKLTWKKGGSIEAITADAKNRKRVKDTLSGLGSPNIVEDEASLIPDDLQAMILRMLGGHQGGTLIKIGNPYVRGHFFKTWNSDKYKKVFIDYHQGLKEGRFTEEFIDEMREEAFFDILYECKFPADDEMDMTGYRRLLTDGEVITAKKVEKHNDNFKLGFDVGEGGDENVAILRSDKYAEIKHRSRISDLMVTVKTITELIDKYLGGKDYADNCFVDDTGIGAGVVDRCHELGYEVTGIKWASKPVEDTFANLKAENFWSLRQWIKDGNSLEPNDAWNELNIIRYKEDSSGKMKIKPKEELRKEGIKSPNVADALALSFNRNYSPRATWL